VVCKVDTQGKETVLYTFTGITGDSPEPLGGLIRDKAGNLYGVTFYGGGTVAVMVLLPGRRRLRRHLQANPVMSRLLEF
jgi:hypothetical protein